MNNAANTSLTHPFLKKTLELWLNTERSSQFYQRHNCHRQIRLCLRACLLALFFGVMSLGGGVPLKAQTAACTDGGITGTLFRDYNANGVQDALEPGLGDIVVTAYDASGGTASCESMADGHYGIDPAGAYPVRLEFTLPADGSLNFLKPGATGSASRTSVTFVDGPTANVNSGFSSPSDFCGATPSPTLATSCFVFGEQKDNPNGVNKEHSVMYAFPYTAGSTDLTNEPVVRTPLPTQLALAKQIGSVWGLAWNPQNQTLYAAAFLKRHAGLGPNGPGAIYQITAAGVTLFHDFGAIAGQDPHPPPGQTCASPGHNANSTNANCWLNDINAFDQVGKGAFGDIEMSDDFSTLYAVNLADKSLLVIPVANPGATTALAVPTPANCPATDVRPFGLGVKDGKVYVGMVCSAESTTNRANLRAYVYTFVNGAFAATPALEVNLATYRSGNTQWQYWLNRTTFNRNDPNHAGGKWAQPWLSDIDFDGSNHMILGLRDRNADQFGTVAGGPDPADPVNYSAVSRGDILRACADGNGGWQLESNGSCGGLTTAGAGNGQGPGGGEYYFQDQQFDPPHVETSLGSQVQVPGLPDVVSLVFNPIEGENAVSDSGVKWYSNQSGITQRGYLLDDRSADPALFGKANGLGDIESLCPAAPLEIGNRVWQDTDGDGVQDPGEPGLGGVTVELYRDGVLVASTTTTPDGQYLFNDRNVTQNGAGGIVSGLCGPTGQAVYEVRIPNAIGSSQQSSLAGLVLTQATAGSGANGELRDSNGVLVGNHAIYAIPCSDLSAPGFNNHTYDFGFGPLPAELVAIGNVVFLDLNNNGRFEPDVGDVGIDGVRLSLFASGADPLTAVPLATTTTTVGGFYLFDNLAPGLYFVHLHATNFAPGASLANYRSSTGNGVSDNIDDNVDENGIDDIDLATNGVRSVVYDLQPNSEPVAEAGAGGYGGLLDDNNVNLTADFGVYKPLSLGNRVWLDDGAGGGVANNGVMDGAEVGIGGVTIGLLDSAGNPITDANGQARSTVTDDQGYYFFTNLLPGAYTVLIDASNFATGGPLNNRNSSEPTEETPNNNGDRNDNGMNVPNPELTGVPSGVVTLDYTTTPINETDLGPVGTTEPPATNNLTVDFGFVAIPTAIDDGTEPTRLRQIYLPAIRQSLAIDR